MRIVERVQRGLLRVAVALVVLSGAGLVLLGPGAARGAGDMDATGTGSAARQYTYAWMFSDDDAMKPRGGTTSGPQVTLDTRVADAFTALQAPGLLARERDRRAILAMVGDYRTSFDFIETVGFAPGYVPRRPYQSWGTERVYLVADEPGFISLQHVIVMHFAADDGSVSEPMVVKHWRQDWRYEDRAMHAFRGPGYWEREALSAQEAAGAWTQTVYQVDDSPRYEAVGRWVHSPGVSMWQSEPMRRPLPRREFSVRDDYQALYGTVRISITPHGWSMEEDALKQVLTVDHEPDASMPYLAREAGLSRYERLRDYDFAAGDAYWEKTGSFWALVRAYWDAIYAGQASFSLRKTADGMPLFMALFGLAEETDLTPEEQRRRLADTMARYVTLGETGGNPVGNNRGDDPGEDNRGEDNPGA
jgi:hypothetical protein